MINQSLVNFLLLCTSEVFLAASRHQLIRGEMWVCRCRNPRPTKTSLTRRCERKKKTFSGQSLSCTSQGYCSSQTGLAEHSPSLRSGLQRLVSSRCKTTRSCPRERARVTPMITSRGHGLPSVTISAKCPVLPLTPAQFVTIPIDALSLCLLSAHPSLSVTLAQSRVCFLCHCESLQIHFFWLSNTAHLSGSHITVISHNITRRTSAAVKHWFCPALQSEHRMRATETELDKAVLPSV